MSKKDMPEGKKDKASSGKQRDDGKKMSRCDWEATGARPKDIAEAKEPSTKNKVKTTQVY